MSGAKSRQSGDITLKQQILEWWAALPEPTTRAVADLLDTSVDYVRVVVRQRGKNGTSRHDKNYRQKHIAETGMTPEKFRYHTNPESRAKTCARNNRWEKRKLERDPLYRDYCNRRRREWVKREFGGDYKYKLFLRARKAAQASKERV